MSESSPYSTQRPLNELFQTDELAASEFLREHKRSTTLYPEQKLLFALLQDAIACFQRFAMSGEEKEQKLYESATRWIFEQPFDAPVTFEMACAGCGFDADYLRSGLVKWHARQLQPLSPGKALHRSNGFSYKVQQRQPRPHGRNGAPL